jgi:phosphomannomutase
MRRLLERHGIRPTEIHGYTDPSFSGLSPEPIMPQLAALRDSVVSSHADVGFATDGDADRIGAIDRDGTFIDSHNIFAILLRYLFEVRGMTGDVAKTFSTTKLIDKIAAGYGLRVHETPIGFKHICDLILSHKILIGGEESGGIGVPALGGPERDGILNALLLAEAMAHYGKTLGELVAGLHDEFGPHHTGRVDLDLRPGQKEKAIEAVSRPIADFAGERVVRVETLDGVKLYLDSGTWVLVRPSGTEPLLRLYAEGETPDAVRTVLSQAEAFVTRL